MTVDFPGRDSVFTVPSRRSFLKVGTAALAAASTHAGWAAESSGPKLDVDWESFLAQHDPVWTRLPLNYFEGPFVGNGMLGAILYAEGNALRIELGRTDVYDHRPGNPIHYSARLPIGHLLLSPAGRITESGFRISLLRGEVTGTVKTDKGSIELRLWAPPVEGLILEYSTQGGESGATLKLVPEQGQSSRWIAEPNRDRNFTYVPNPPFVVTQVGEIEVVTQPLLAGSDYATAWTTLATGSKRVAIIGIANLRTTTGSAAHALATLHHIITTGLGTLEQAHRDWWRKFYPASFATFFDARLESFYWIQLYKLASATRAEGPVIDLMGPWYKHSVWAAYWMNLNTQLNYYSVLPTNHPELGDPLCRLLWERREDLIHNVPPEYQSDSAALGNPTGFGSLVAPGPGPAKGKLAAGYYAFIALPWLMQQFYLQYRFTMSGARAELRLRNEIFPLLKRTVNTYLHLIEIGSDGRYHIPRAFSDEYGVAEDTNLNHALLRWCLRTLLAIDSRLMLNDPERPRWNEVLTQLADYPVDSTGLMIGKNVPFARPHRHSSHLFAIFPLHVLNVDDNPDKLDLILRSIEHFLSFHGDDCIFKFTAAASLYAALGKGDEALVELKRALEPQPEGPTITANTLYSENGWPTFESPISAQRAMLDMYLQSWGNRIRIFPALPSQWQDAAFHRLRAEGGFLVSARRTSGRTTLVAIESLSGEPCRLQTNLEEPFNIFGVAASRLRRLHPATTSTPGLYELSLRRGEHALLVSLGSDARIEPLSHAVAASNAWGAKAST